jgi:hypothetical protein
VDNQETQCVIATRTNSQTKDPGRDWSGVFDWSRRGRVAGLASVRTSTRVGFRSSNRGVAQCGGRGRAGAPQNEKPRRGERGFPIETAAGGIGGADERPSTSPEYRLVATAAGKVQEHREKFRDLIIKEEKQRVGYESRSNPPLRQSLGRSDTTKRASIDQQGRAACPILARGLHSPETASPRGGLLCRTPQLTNSGIF